MVMVRFMTENTVIVFSIQIITRELMERDS